MNATTVRMKLIVRRLVSVGLLAHSDVATESSLLRSLLRSKRRRIVPGR